MDASLVLVAVTQGMVLGILGFDMYARLEDRKARAALRGELEAAQGKLAELHNKSAIEVQMIRDRVNSLSLTFGKVK